MVNVDEKNVDRCDGGEEVNGSAGVWADEQAWATLEWQLAGNAGCWSVLGWMLLLDEKRRSWDSRFVARQCIGSMQCGSGTHVVDGIIVKQQQQQGYAAGSQTAVMSQHWRLGF